MIPRMTCSHCMMIIQTSTALSSLTVTRLMHNMTGADRGDYSPCPRFPIARKMRTITSSEMRSAMQQKIVALESAWTQQRDAEPEQPRRVGDQAGQAARHENEEARWIVGKQIAQKERDKQDAQHAAQVAQTARQRSAPQDEPRENEGAYAGQAERQNATWIELVGQRAQVGRMGGSRNDH